MKYPYPLRIFRRCYQFDSSNFLTLTNPKVLKSAKIAPTAVLHLLPTSTACPAAGACRALCLNKAGNPTYLKGKLACRARRDKAFRESPEHFMQNLLVEILRFYRANADHDNLGCRLNGTSDYRWEDIPLVVTPELSTFIHARFGIRIVPKTYYSIILAVNTAYDAECKRFVDSVLTFYDYTKRLDRLFVRAKVLGYHLTMSHGGKYDVWPTAIREGLNVACGLDGIKRSQALPRYVYVGDRSFAVLDGDVTDWRPGDANHHTHIVGLRIKRTPGQTDAQRQAFCLPVSPVLEPVAA